MLTTTQTPTDYAQRVAQLVQAMPEDVAREVLHYAEYMDARLKVIDAKWDVLFASTTDEQWDSLIAIWMQGETTDIAVEGDELVPISASNL